jgi:hypothetical protein
MSGQLVEEAKAKVINFSQDFMSDYPVLRTGTAIYGMISLVLFSIEILILILAGLYSIVRGTVSSESFKFSHAREAFTSPITKGTKNIYRGIKRVFR